MILFRTDKADRDLDDEVQLFVEEAISAQIAKGMSPDEARRAVRLEYGVPVVIREEVRAGGWEHALELLAADARYAIRGLRATAGFTAVALTTLAIGIGATTAIFSAVKPVLFEPLPYRDAGRLVAIWDRSPDSSPSALTFGTYRELIARTRSFEAIAVSKPWQPTLTGAAEPERLDGQRVSATYFRTLGVHMARGRDFLEDDDRPGAARVAIITDGLWQRRFGADSSIVGRDITLDDARFTVVGVMPPSFENVAHESAEIWSTLQYDPTLPSDGREWGHHLQGIGRVRERTSVDAASAECEQIARHPVVEYPRMAWASLRGGLLVRALQDDLASGVRPALVAILGAAAIVLLIACVNVTNLLLARGARRREEFAMRAALGASRSRLIRQLLTETALLSLMGGAVGVALAYAGVPAIVALSPLPLPRLSAVRVDSTALIFALLATSIVTIVIGIMPARHAARAHQDGSLRTSRTTTSSHRRARGILVVAEIALAIVLLVSAGLLVRSLQRLFAVDVGFNPSKLLTMQVQVAGRGYDRADAIERFFDQALDAVRRLPGVTSAAFTSQLPLSGDFEKYGTQFESSPTEKLEDDHSALRYAVSADYIGTMRIPLRNGRPFTDRDIDRMPSVALINEAFAKRRFPSSDPVGQRLHLGRTDQPWITIVGVVGNVRQTSLALAQPDAVYVPASQWYARDRVRSFVVRTNGTPSALTPSIRQAIWSIDKDQPIVRVATMDALLAGTAAERRFALALFELFAGAALVLAAVGIYGVLAGSVTERVREIGVRAALGASRSDILRLVMGTGMTLAGAGVVVGVAAAALASRALMTMLFGVSPLDPTTYAVVVGLLAVVAAGACAVPTWRAVHVDPSVTLRAE